MISATNNGACDSTHWHLLGSNSIAGWLTKNMILMSFIKSTRPMNGEIHGESRHDIHLTMYI